MNAASIMTAGVNVILAALTPAQKWNAARQFDRSLMSERWFILAGLATIIILILLLIAASYHRRTEERRIRNRRFMEYADKIGLTRRERQILQDIAIRAGLRHNVSIYSMIEAFDRGASGILEDTLTLKGIEAGKRLSTVMSALREKLGFEKQHAAPLGSSRPTSRQIPTGKKLYVTYLNADDPTNFESIVIKNDDVQLTARLATPMQRSAGELCSVRYGFGGSVWEYDATVVSCDGDVLVLTHNNNVRFINRRRFLRVPVHKVAFMAHFPFVRTLTTDTGGGGDDRAGSTEGNEKYWAALDFIPAVVTELAGPGLRIEAPLDVKIGERVLIIFKLNEENPQGSPASSNEHSPQSNTKSRDKVTPLKIVEDIGEIRHIEATQDGFSTGVELMGLNDSDVNELIRATNAASMKAKADTQDVPTSDTEDFGQTIPEPIVAQGM